MTLGSFIDRGAVRIPGFQRHFVWDLPRASRLIESLILGLPVPQLFLYEESRNRFLVIDGQQLLMSIYYFIKRRFPRPERRQKLRAVFDDVGRIPDDVLNDDDCFRPFKLRLSGRFSDQSSRFHGMDYDSLGDYRSQFDLRPLRNIIVKQRRRVTGALSEERVRALRKDDEFMAAAASNTTSTANLRKRLSRSVEIVGAL